MTVASITEINRQTTATVVINVKRNENKPKFRNNNYRFQLEESSPIGESLFSVNATDDDGDTMKYSIIGDDLAKEYFFIESATGLVTLKKHLDTGTFKTINVREK